MECPRTVAEDLVVRLGVFVSFYHSIRINFLYPSQYFPVAFFFLASYPFLSAALRLWSSYAGVTQYLHHLAHPINYVILLIAVESKVTLRYKGNDILVDDNLGTVVTRLSTSSLSATSLNSRLAIEGDLLTSSAGDKGHDLDDSILLVFATRRHHVGFGHCHSQFATSIYPL